jgi:AcrR family transcriptional regulator
MGTAAQDSPATRHRERLLEGLAASIRERGLAETQLTDIVRHARASRTTFYNCFADKESCFVELVREATTLGIALVEAAVDPSAPWRQQVDDGVEAYFAALTADPAMTVAVSRDLASLGARGVAVVQEGVERYAEVLCRLTGRDAMRSAGVMGLSMDAAVLLVGGINAMVVHAIERGDDIGKLIPIAKRAVVGMLDPA